MSVNLADSIRINDAGEVVGSDASFSFDEKVAMKIASGSVDPEVMELLTPHMSDASSFQENTEYGDSAQFNRIMGRRREQVRIALDAMPEVAEDTLRILDRGRVRLVDYEAGSFHKEVIQALKAGKAVASVVIKIRTDCRRAGEYVDGLGEDALEAAKRECILTSVLACVAKIFASEAEPWEVQCMLRDLEELEMGLDDFGLSEAKVTTALECYFARLADEADHDSERKRFARQAGSRATSGKRNRVTTA